MADRQRLLLHTLGGAVAGMLVSQAAFATCEFAPKADCSESRLLATSLAGRDLSGMDFSRSEMTGVNFAGANLSDADFSKAKLTGVNFQGAKLARVDFSGANLTGANLTGADLTDADLSGASLTGAKLDGAMLKGASFDGANLVLPGCAREDRACALALIRADDEAPSGRRLHAHSDEHRSGWLHFDPIVVGVYHQLIRFSHALASAVRSLLA